MKKSNNNTWKRIAAGALSLALVAGALPANVGGLLTGGKVLVASAEGEVLTDTIQLYYDSDTEANSNTSRTYHGTYADVSGEYVYQVFNGGSAIIKGLCVYSDDEVTITANNALPANYVIKNVTFDVRSGGANVNESTVAVSSGTITITNAGQTIKIENVNSKKLTLRNQGKRSYDVDSVSITYAEKTDLNTTTVTAENSTYTGSALTPVIEIDGSIRTVGTDYTYEVYDTATPSVTDVPIGDPTNAGTYYVKVTGIGGYTGTRFVEWNVSQATLTLDNLAAGGDLVNGVPGQLTYTGEEQEVKLYYRNGNTYVPLTAGTDYELHPDYPDGSQFDGCPVYSAATDVSNDYEVVINPKGNYKLSGNNELGFLVASWSIAKANLKAGTDYTAPTGSGDLKYKDTAIPLLEDGNTGSVTVDSHTNQPVGTMQYAATRYRAVSANELHISSVDDVNVGDIYKPTRGNGIYFPVGYSIEVGNHHYGYLKDSNGVNFYFSDAWNKCYFLGTNDSVDYNALKITAIDKVNKTITAEGVDYNAAFNELVNHLEWSTGVPQRTDLGNWYVWYKVEGDDNHNSTKPAYVTSKIDYKKSTLTLADSLGAFKVTEVANGTETEVTADNGVYTLSATKTYKIYTQNTVSTDEKSKYRLSEAYHDKENDDDVFEYEYTLKLAVDPAFEAYNLSHLSNWTGKVNSTDPTKLYIADGEVTPNTGKLAATLKANSTYYYGDVIDESSIEIDEAYKALIKVKNVYFSDSTGAAVDINNAKYGTYTLRAEIVVDNNANGKFDDTGVDLSYTVYKDVEYKARPMAENNYFVETPDGKLPLTVANGTVTVPEKYYVYSGFSDILGGSDSDKKYVATEKSEVLSTIFSRCEEKQTFTYNGTEQKPTIIVKNGGNNADVVASIPATDTADAAAKDYIDGVKAETNAGDYSYTLTAETGTTEAPANYSGAVTVKWTIAQADIQQYISVVPKNNVDTDEVVGNDAIVYDGAVLDSTDFEVKTNEAYAALTDSEADKAIKALVDEFIAQLTATPATETTPAVAAKTTVDVAPAIGKVYTENIEYPVADNSFGYDIGMVYGYNKVVQSGFTINYPDSIIFDNDTVNVENRLLNINAYKNIILDNELVNSSKIISDIQLTDTTAEFTYNAENGTLTYGGHTISAKEGYRISISSVRAFPKYNGTTVSFALDFKAVPINGFADGKSNIKDANVEGELKKANVTVKNSNFKDVEFKQTLTNDGKIDTTVEDKSIPVTIAKRAATITPDEDNRITYRNLTAPTLNYEYEKAATEETLLRGVIAADEGLFDSTRQGYVAPIGVKEFNIGELNDAKSYDYEIVDSEVFANYKLSLPTENVPTFTVDPLNLNDIEDLSIVLNGKTNDWTQDGSSGYYTYDGTTKAVEVKKVAKAGNGESVSAEFYSEELVRELEGQDYSATKNDVTVYCKNKTRSSGEPILLDNENDIRLEVSDSMIIESVELQLVNQGTYIINGNEYTTDNCKLTIPGSAISDNRITCSDAMVDCIKVNCTTGDEYVLEADTDYTVGGMTKSATVGEKTVQVKGKGNYTGVAKATWVMKPVDNVEGLVKFKTNATWSEAFQYYDWHYTGEPISCGAEFTDPDSNYAQDAEVTVKYARFNNITKEYEEVDEAVHQGKYKVNVKVECDGYSTVEFNYDINIATKEILLEDTPFTINYGEDYSDHTDELLALFVEKGLLQSDADLIKQMLEDGTLIWYYDYDEDYDEGWLYPTWSPDVFEAAAEEAIKEGKNPGDWTVIESMIHKLYGDAVYQVANAHDNDIMLVNPIIKPKSIKSDDVTVEFTNGNTVVLDENGFVSESSIIVKDTGILNDDGEPTVLIADTDYELNIESTATEGEYIVEVVGKGNYRGIRKVTFTAVTEEETVPKFNINANVARINKGNVYTGVSYSYKLYDGWTLVNYGILYCNDGTITNPADLTLDSTNASIQKKESKTGTNLLDTGKGVVAVGYLTATSPSGVTKTFYSDNIGGKVVNINVNDTVIRINDKNKQLYVGVSYSIKPASNLTVESYGILYCNDGTITDPADLTLDSENASIQKKADKTGTNLLDTGKGVVAVGYNVVEDSSGNTAVIYTGNIGGRAVNITENDPVARTNAGKEYVGVSYAIKPASGLTVESYGILYCNDGTITNPADLTLDSTNASVQKKDGKTGTNLLDTGNGVIAVGYNVVKNDAGQEAIIYTDNIGGKYSELVG